MKSKSDTHGAVTIIVSIMLIPAILLSGTAVDLARIHTARSMAHNANQLAANAALTQYDSLLKDLYGLFGIAEEDPILGDMINDYIEVAIFGEKLENSWIETGLGTYQLFNGSNASAVIKVADGYNLGKSDVLRRQIEEYMKFRGPVILVERLLNSLEIDGKSIKPSGEAIEQQKKVCEKMSELFKMYGELYYAIVTANNCDESGANPSIKLAINEVSDTMVDIKNAFIELKSRYARWDEVRDYIRATVETIAEEEKKINPDNATKAIIGKLKNEKEMYENELEEVRQRYNAKRDHIEKLTNGGDWTDWTVGRKIIKKDNYGISEKLADGTTDVWEWSVGESSEGGRNLKSIQTKINEAMRVADSFKQNFTNVVAKAGAIDDKRPQIKAEINTLKQKLADPNVDPDLKSEINNVVTSCETFLEWFPSIKPLAERYKTEGNKYIDEKVKKMLTDINDTGYSEYSGRGNSNNNKLTLQQLGGITTNSAFDLTESKSADVSSASIYASFVDVTYYMPSGFIKFRKIDNDHNGCCVDVNGKPICENSKGNCALYDALEKMVTEGVKKSHYEFAGLKDESGSTDPETRQQNIIDQLKNLAEAAKNGPINNPEGSMKINDDSYIEGKMGNFNNGAVIDLVSDPFNAIQNMADWALMMTYCTSMFSNYTTGKPSEREDRKSPESLTCVQMKPEVNYFYQSEWEFLLVGKNDADKNLSTVRDLIFTIRMICNTIAAFKDPVAKSVAQAVQSAMSAVPYVGSVLGVVMYFATIEAFAAADSAIDLIRLRNGFRVPVLKPRLDITGGDGKIVKVLENIASNGDDISVSKSDEEGVTYEHYMMAFFLATTNTDVLVKRTAKLIEWNANNYRSQVNASNMDKGFVKTEDAVNAMSAALADPKCIRLKKRYTDFNITTTIDLRLFFLSMPIFTQQGSPFSTTFSIIATDYRGY